ncbi:Lsr2 family protein [Curtobacterium sp. MCLR17_054]|uniref:histone-like nucleoid-structuring protein Lsr2 n=1 Tax=Curtobacterium sp. MCLR17_054 TaxID=2175632 RepID=UPI000DAA3BCA|nr:Lsr2 family protein [Curtobacterium sp. MCLR17_054]WIE70326.1 Lsr2 family protein [Curtobacterium sp. MCLR17_054]
MAQQITTNLIDDLTGDVIEPGTGKTVSFAFDGTHYEIDLTDTNAEQFRTVVADYIAAARKITRKNSTEKRSTSRSNADELARIREWAASNGYEVSARGRISQTVKDAYAAAH